MNPLSILTLAIFIGGGMHAAEPSQSAKNQTAFASLPKYQLKDFSHLLGNVKGLDDALLKMHFKLYEGYVNQTNIILEKLGEMTRSGLNKTPEFSGLKKNLGWEFDGMLLHEYYFENLGGNGRIDEKMPLFEKIKKDFGSYEAWKNDFVSTGLMRGIGWVVTYLEPKNGRLINEWINEHDLGHLAGATPLIIMDVFEHAYITQFGLDRQKYIDTFFDNLNWNVVSQRFQNETKETHIPKNNF